MDLFEKLQVLRRSGGEIETTGLDETRLKPFLTADPLLAEAVTAAHDAYLALAADDPESAALGEREQIARVQHDYLNFYPEDAVNPYVALAARGPWIVTSKGAVLYDAGGYGMLGLGHAPPAVLAALAGPYVMANVMTPNFSQMRLGKALRREIGRQRPGGCPFARFLCVNSGSEAVSVAARIADINARIQTDPSGPARGHKIQRLGLRGGFHGRTDRPARYSDSSHKVYASHLASFRDRDDLLTVELNSTTQLAQIFEFCRHNRIFIEALFIEPVMGEGNPGAGITPEFYALARQLTLEHGTLLLVDSIQAGLRAHGVLSITDYPGFETLPPPDMETYSKALNAGQFPLSVLALTERAAALYRKGVYGNTMTTNPRALEVAVAVLDSLTPKLRANIRERGAELVERFEALRGEIDGAIVRVQGTGLLFSLELDSRVYKCFGRDSIEEYLRHHGINVIHGGENALRYTPHFAINGAEVELLVTATREALLHGPRKAAVEEAA